jgi:hypothetical protein
MLKNPGILRKNGILRKPGGDKSDGTLPIALIAFAFCLVRQIIQKSGRCVNRVLFYGGFLRCMRSRSTTPATAGAKGAAGVSGKTLPALCLVHFPLAFRRLMF